MNAATVFEGELHVIGSNQSSAPSTRKRPHLLLRGAVEKLNGAVAGYVLSEQGVDRAMADLADAVMDPELPVLEVDEQLSVLRGRIPGKLFDSITDMLKEHKDLIAEQAGSGVQLK